jgi:hypothetical protein
MFESICFGIQNKEDASRPIDIGALVEGMLFYKRTIVVANKAILAQLINYFGVERILTMMKEELLDILYTESNVGIITTTKGNIQYHDPIEFSSPQHTYQDELRSMCIATAGKTGKGRRLALRIQDKIRVVQHDHIILEGARRSILDQNYVGTAAATVIKQLVPEVGEMSGMSFQTKRTSDGIIVDTNINFSVLNELYHRRIPPEHSSVSPALILSHLLDLEKELYFSSTNLSELASSQLSAQLAEKKIDYILARTQKSRDTLNNFSAFVFGDARALREAVNFGHLNLDDLVSVLCKSRKFKDWIVGTKPDTDLVKNYYDEVTRETIIDRLPAKTVRWAVFTGLGLAADTLFAGGLGTVTGLVISSLDAFLVDKMVSGWKPNQFIERDLREILKKST